MTLRRTHLRLLVTSIFSSLVLLLCPVGVSAHIFRQDNGITVELHIPPNDRPVAGANTIYQLSFEEEPASFELHNYTLNVTFLDGTHVIGHHTLKTSQSTKVIDSFVFPHGGDYVIRLEGNFLPAATNSSFVVTFPVHILPNSTPKHTISPMAWAAGGISLAVLLGIGYAFERKNQQTTHDN